MYVSSECTEGKGNNTGPEFRNLGGDLELDSGEYILLGYKEVSGPAWVLTQETWEYLRVLRSTQG